MSAHVITHAEGVYLYDSEGHRLLDGMAGLWCVNVGYGRQELADVAATQMKKLPYYNSFSKSTNPPAIELATLLAEVSPPQFSRVFYAGSGSEANDTIVEMVRRYWEVLGKPQRKTIISRVNAYHGSTPDLEHIEQPYAYKSAGDLSPEDFGVWAAHRLAERIDEIGADKVAAFIGEPVQGPGGVIIPPTTYWPEIQRVCDYYGILLIADEVICGFGRLGSWFGHEQFGIRPDFMTLAKGITSGYVPLGAVMVADRVADVLIEQGGELNQGYTDSGHPVACAVGARNIQMIRDEKLIERVREEIGPYLQQRWRMLADHPLVAEARGLGLIGALELSPDKAARRAFEKPGHAGTLCRDFCYANGLVMRAVLDTMIISPPLIIEKSHVDELVEKAWRCLDLTQHALAAGE